MHLDGAAIFNLIMYSNIRVKHPQTLAHRRVKADNKLSVKPMDTSYCM